MNRLLLTRSIDAFLDRVWEILSDPGVCPGPDIDVQVERPGSVDGTAGGGTLVSWSAESRPVVPGTGWAVSLAAKRTFNRVLDAVSERSKDHERSKDGYTSRA